MKGNRIGNTISLVLFVRQKGATFILPQLRQIYSLGTPMSRTNTEVAMNKKQEPKSHHRSRLPVPPGRFQEGAGWLPPVQTCGCDDSGGRFASRFRSWTNGTRNRRCVGTAAGSPPGTRCRSPSPRGRAPGLGTSWCCRNRVFLGKKKVGHHQSRVTMSIAMSAAWTSSRRSWMLLLFVLVCDVWVQTYIRSWADLPMARASDARETTSNDKKNGSKHPNVG